MPDDLFIVRCFQVLALTTLAMVDLVLAAAAVRLAVGAGSPRLPRRVIEEEREHRNAERDADRARNRVGTIEA